MSDTAPIEHPSRLTVGDFTAADEPLRLLRPVAGGRHPQRAGRSQRHGARHRRFRRPAQRPDGAAEGLRRARLRLLHQHGQPKGAGVGRQSQGRAAVPLEIQEPAGAAARPGRARSPTPKPTPISPPARGCRRSAPGPASNRRRWKAGSPSRRRSRSTPPSSRSAAVPRPPYWSGLSRHSAEHRVLAGPAVPPARPRRVPPRADGAPWSKTRLYP